MTKENLQSLIEIYRTQYGENHMIAFTKALPPHRRQAVQHLMQEFTACIPRTLSQLQQVQLLYDVIVSDVSYRDSDACLTQYSYLQPLLKSTGVCEGIAELFFLLAQELGIETKIVIGVAGSADDQGLHAWNMVRLPVDGKKQWFHLDATWDLGKGHWQYFLKSDQYMQQHQHEWLPMVLPTAPRNHPSLPRLNQVGIQKLMRYLNQLRNELKQKGA